jgi:hypothetical protein
MPFLGIDNGASQCAGSPASHFHADQPIAGLVPEGAHDVRFRLMRGVADTCPVWRGSWSILVLYPDHLHWQFESRLRPLSIVMTASHMPMSLVEEAVHEEKPKRLIQMMRPYS